MGLVGPGALVPGGGRLEAPPGLPAPPQTPQGPSPAPAPARAGLTCADSLCSPCFPCSCHLATLHLLARRREINGAEQDRGPCRAMHPLPATRSSSKSPACAYPFPKALEFGVCASPVIPGTSGGAFCPCHAHFSAVGSLSHLGWDPGAELRPLLSLRAVFLEPSTGNTFPFIVPARHGWIPFLSFFISTKMSVCKAYY